MIGARVMRQVGAITALVCGLAGYAQVPTYHSSFSLEGVMIVDMVALPGGDLFAVGGYGMTGSGVPVSKFISRWTNDGDTVWTHGLDEEGTVWFHQVRLLNTGEILAHDLRTSYLFDVDGVEVASFPHPNANGVGGDVIEVGPDSLVVCSDLAIAMVDRTGAELWSRPLVQPEGLDYASNMVVRVADRLVVCSASSMYMPGGMDPRSTIHLGWYGLDGSFVDTLRLDHSPAGQVNSSVEFIRTVDGGALGLAKRGTAEPYIIRLDAQGDLAWVKWLPFHDPPPADLTHWIDPFAIVERPDGHILLTGPGGTLHGPDAWNVFGIGVMELDALGDPVCYEPVSPVTDAPGAYRADLAIDGQGDLHLAYMMTAEGLVPETYMAGIGRLCLSTGGAPGAFDGSCMRISSFSNGWQVDRTACNGEAIYAIHDAAGRQHASGRLGAGLGTIMVPALIPGIYMIRVEDRDTGSTTVVKWAVAK